MLKQFISTIITDYQHYRFGSFYVLRVSDPSLHPPRRILRALLDIDFRVVLFFRISSILWKTGFRVLSLIIYLHLKSRYSIVMHPSLEIGPGLRLVHAFCIVVGSDVKVGNDVIIFGQTFLGKSRPDLIGSKMPRVGNRVLLGSGCKILGDVEIPSQNIVPANAVITRSSLQKTKLVSI